MKFIRRNFGIILFYALIVSLAFLFEIPTEKPTVKVNPSKDLVVINNN